MIKQMPVWWVTLGPKEFADNRRGTGRRISQRFKTMPVTRQIPAHSCFTNKTTEFFYENPKPKATWSHVSFIGIRSWQAIVWVAVSWSDLPQLTVDFQAGWPQVYRSPYGVDPMDSKSWEEMRNVWVSHGDPGNHTLIAQSLSKQLNSLSLLYRGEGLTSVYNKREGLWWYGSVQWQAGAGGSK